MQETQENASSQAHNQSPGTAPHRTDLDIRDWDIRDWKKKTHGMPCHPQRPQRLTPAYG